jgi:hypothetical protein
MLAIGVLGHVVVAGAASPGAVEFRRDIEPIIKEFCYDCHGDGMDKGKVAFDEFNPDKDLTTSQDLWWRALKNLRAGMMPPPKKPHPSPEQVAQIERWIKSQVFAANPQNPDPGRVTLRRLNRVEYRNTIRDLTGVDYDTNAEFPPDDTGHGFDNIGDVLTLPPMLLEKYLEAARTIVGRTVPQASRVVQEQVVPGRRFQSNEDGPASLPFYSAAAVSNTFKTKQPGKYQLTVDLAVNERYVDNVFDYNKCRLIFKVDGKEMLQKEFSWQGGRSYRYDVDADWAAGDHQLAFELQPLTTNEPTRTLSVQISSVTVRGPLAKEAWVKPRNYDRFFPKDVPESAAARRAYASELLGKFAGKAFRRPANEGTVKRLTDLAEGIYKQRGKTFEEGVSQAMVAVLASPRFLFLEETVEPGSGSTGYANVDEYSLASRLSYFLWSSMPDDELFRLAGERKLRQDLPGQVKRMLADSRSDALVKNFTGQWLQARDVESVTIDSRAVLGREERFDPEAERMQRRFRELRDKSDEQLTPAEKEELEKLRPIFRQRFRRTPRAELTGELRRAMRQETEGVFDYVVREDRNLLELVDSDYTFLNEKLATHYGITNVTGNKVRLVKLPPDSPRGGILTQGTVLAVTSNPTRTSPVKRGVFILDNILGTPPPPPPPDIPPLEDSAKGVSNRPPTLRETLAVHRENALCSSCHNRMDPLGLAFENFNAMGMWRDQELGEPVDATGQLITGEKFNGVKELKRLLAEKYSRSFYRTITEKMLTYALGRGLEYYDVQTVDQIVTELEKAGGRPSALLMGVVESAPFQKTRTRVGQAGTEPGIKAPAAKTAHKVHPPMNQNAGLQSETKGLTVLAHRALNNETRP